MLNPTKKWDFLALNLCKDDFPQGFCTSSIVTFVKIQKLTS